MNKILRSIYLVMLIAGLSTPAAAKKSTLNLKGHASTGLNALDYKLQKPLGNDTFPAGQDGFDQNFFIGGGLGLSTQTVPFGNMHPGMLIEGQT
ncbi:MAG: hypothetical protein K2N10_08545, partial [Muribaculaceae bacterium]|nr:hypothetical protein [Muribaculaceae bacterium]